MFNCIRCLTNIIGPTTVPIRDKKGNTITAMEGQIYRWEAYFEEIRVLNTPTPPTEKEAPGRQSKELPISTRPLSKREIVNANKSNEKWENCGIR
jgi:hypothetical protein